MKYFSIFQNSSEYAGAKSSLIRPHVSLIENDNDVEYLSLTSSVNDYLTFVALESGTFKFSNAASYSTNNGQTWTSLAANTNTPTISSGQRIMWKANITTQAYAGVGTFTSTCDFNVEGNAMSLMYGDNFANKTSFNSAQDNSGFGKLFSGNTHVVSAKNLHLPATTLNVGSYLSMFQGCTSLTSAPSLPATELTTNCYYSMFEGCSSLTSAPILHATVAVSGCYGNIFKNCSSLNYIKCSAIVGTEYIESNSWSGVANTGTFVKSSLATFPTPTDWTIVNQ